MLKYKQKSNKGVGPMSRLCIRGSKISKEGEESWAA